MNRLILFLLFCSSVAFGQQSNLYRPDGKLIADTTYQVDENAYSSAKTIEKVLLPRMYNAIGYPEVAKENGIEGIIVVQLFVFQREFKYTVVRSDNDYLKAPVVAYFDHLDKQTIDQIRPTKGYISFFIPVVFKIRKDQFKENLKKQGSLVIETNEIAIVSDIVR